MPAIGSIKTASLLGTTVRTSSATVSYDKTFDPAGIDTKGVARWEDRSGGIAVGFPALTMSLRRPTVGSRMYKVTAKLSLPTLEVTAPTTVTGIQPQPQKAYDCSVVMEFMLPERSTLAERTALLNHCHSLFAATINASDDSPTDSSGTPLLAGVMNFDPVY